MLNRIAISLGFIALAGFLMGSNCRPETCRTRVPAIEMTINFVGFNNGDAVRIEFESTIRTPLRPGFDAPSNYTERRIGSIDFAAVAANPDFPRFLLDLGSYLRSFEGAEGATFEYDLRVRVFGSGNALLAEGRFQRNGLLTHGCHIFNMDVNANQTCDGKEEGTPCAGGPSSPRVCKDVGGSLSCEASTCGDGFTDRAIGELCDPEAPLPHPALSTFDCSPVTCIPNPIVVNVAASADLGLLRQTVTLANDGDAIAGPTALGGFDDPGYPDIYKATSPLDASAIALNVLAFDAQGNSADDLVIGVPGARWPAGGSAENTDTNGVTKNGMVMMRDWPIIGQVTLADIGTTKLTVLGRNHPGSVMTPSFFGAALAAGDLDGDGVRDILIGAPADAGNAGAMFVVYGSVPSSSGGLQVDAPGQNTSPLYKKIVGNPEDSGSTGDYLGYAIATGDFDGDGNTDVAVAGPRNSSSSQDRRGAVFILRGGVGDWRNSAPALVSEPALLGRTITSFTANMRLGISLASGDVDGDGFTDLVIGSGEEQSSDPDVVDPDYFGGIYVLFGGPDVMNGDSTEADNPGTFSSDELAAITIQASESERYGFGGQVAAVDLDGDGKAEVAVSTGRLGSITRPHTVTVLAGRGFDAYRGNGGTDLFAGSMTMTAPTDWAFGAFLGAGDTNGDNRADLMIGAPMQPSNEVPAAPNAGAIYFILASAAADYSGSYDFADVANLMPPGNAPFPLVVVQETQPESYFGISATVSSHLPQPSITPPRSYTYVAKAGFDNFRGRINALLVAHLLQCNAQGSCGPETDTNCNDGTDNDLDGDVDCDDADCASFPGCP